MREKFRPKPKSGEVNKLQAEKAKAINVYKKFDLYAKNYGTDKGLENTFGRDVDVEALRQHPKYKPLFDKIKSLSQAGLGCLSFIRGLTIEKGKNLLKLKYRLNKFKRTLRKTLANWRKTNTKIENLVAVEKKRGELFAKLGENTGGYLLGKFDKMIDATYMRAFGQITDSPEYNKMWEKIRTASLDELNVMYRDESIFKPLLEKTKMIIKAEQTRERMITDLGEYPYESTESVPYLKTVKQRMSAVHAIKQSDAYMHAEYIIKGSKPEEILKFVETPDYFQKYWDQFLVIGYQYANEERLDKALKPYLKLKPKDVSEDQFLASLKDSSYYKRAFDVIQKGGIDEQKDFDPLKYVNFEAEQAIQLAKANGSDTLYKYAKLLADNLQTPQGKFVDDESNFA